jgi:leucyl aminopeptidase
MKRNYFMKQTETLLVDCDDSHAVEILVFTTKQSENFSSMVSEELFNWLKQASPNLKAGEFCLKRDRLGAVSTVFFILDDVFDHRAISSLAAQLPTAHYKLQVLCDWGQDSLFHFCIAWGRAAYTFSRYKSCSAPTACLSVPKSVDFKYLQNWLGVMGDAKDMINTPAEDLNPQHMVRICEDWAAEHGMSISIIQGENLLKQGYPMIHAIGRGSDIPPALIDMRWGNSGDPKVTLIGKGVCFDTGGLNLKSTAGMRYMKKDMGGAAMAFALMQMIVLEKLPIQLRLIIPAIKNSVSASSLLPGDVIKTRSGTTVEITNTDAEGRLILCEALTAACDDEPDYLFDFATLTGAARVALGPDLPALFSNNDALGSELQCISNEVNDPVWQLPLYKGYLTYMKSELADLMNSSSSSFAGAITAALYLQEFVSGTVKWAHLDAYCWNPKLTSGYAIGGDTQSIQTVFAYLVRKFCENKASNITGDIA